MDKRELFGLRAVEPLLSPSRRARPRGIEGPDAMFDRVTSLSGNEQADGAGTDTETASTVGGKDSAASQRGRDPSIDETDLQGWLR